MCECANGEWRMANGEWRMANGEWRMKIIHLLRYIIIVISCEEKNTRAKGNYLPKKVQYFNYV